MLDEPGQTPGSYQGRRPLRRRGDLSPTPRPHDGEIQDLDTIAFAPALHDSQTVPFIQDTPGPSFSDGLLAAPPDLDEPSLTKLCSSALKSSLPRIFPEAAGGPRYEYESVLGQGGMGKVLAVFDRDVRRRVALKVLLTDQANEPPSDLRSRFVEEVQIAGQLEHPNILPIYDWGLSKDEPYFTMKLVEGSSLREIMDKLRAGDEACHQEYSLTRRLQVFQQICLAMAYSHSKGVLHRDLKPDNVMIGAFGEVLVVDWGLAMTIGSGVDVSAPKNPRFGEQFSNSESGGSPSRRLVETSAQGTRDRAEGLVYGTPAYMSPEQARGAVKSLTLRSDIYSLGAILYELLVFSVPLRGRSTSETLMKVVREVPEAPGQVAARWGFDLSPDLDAITLRALSKDPNLRQGSADVLAKDVQAVIDGSLQAERRTREADAHVQVGFEKTRRVFAIRNEITRVRRSLEQAVQEQEDHAPLAEKHHLWEMEDQLEHLRAELVTMVEAAHDAFDAALGAAPNHGPAREAKADLFWESFLDEEGQGHHAAAQHFRARVEAFHDGKYQDELAFAGKLTLTASGPILALNCQPWVEQYRTMRPGDKRVLDPNQESWSRLEPGVYQICALVEMGERFQEAKPRELSGLVSLQRGADAHLLLVPPPQDLGDFLPIHGGQAQLGGDHDAPSAWPRRRVEISPFLMARFPVTALDYSIYLNELLQRDPNQASLRLPRQRADATPLWIIRNGLVTIEEQTLFDHPWRPDWPIFGLSYADAQAYCHWYSLRRGLAVRLPTESEWEWVARGPGAWLYPWGMHFDASCCKMKLSRAGFPLPEPIGSFERDTSIFGVRDLAGGVHEWCSSEFDDERGMVTLRGASWMSRAECCRAAARLGDQPYDRHLSYGFRLARDWPQEQT